MFRHSAKFSGHQRFSWRINRAWAIEQPVIDLPGAGFADKTGRIFPRSTENEHHPPP
jgi:hypothetical protein